MNILKRTMIVALPAALLAACTGAKVDQLQETTITGTDFNSYLARDYRDLAVFEEDKMYDTIDAQKWAEKGLMAASGKTPAPTEPKDWDIGDDAKMKELQAARAKLMAGLAGGGRDKFPKVGARAQTQYDCWVEQEEEGWQTKHIAACRQGFWRAMNVLDNRLASLKPKPAPVAAAVLPRIHPVQYWVFFAHDSAVLTREAQVLISSLAKRTREIQDPNILIEGHADRSGSAAYNQALSARRAEAVLKALVDSGVDANIIRIEGEGETEPLVKTGDGVRHPRNRRVLIVLGSLKG